MVDNEAELGGAATVQNASLPTDEKLEVKASNIPNAGLGLFAKQSISKDAVVCEYTGTQLTLREFLQTKDHKYMMGGFGINCHLDAKKLSRCPSQFWVDTSTILSTKPSLMSSSLN
eukprot:Filipodium_phascolosomae@DN7124_c0_g1_i1.p1